MEQCRKTTLNKLKAKLAYPEQQYEQREEWTTHDTLHVEIKCEPSNSGQYGWSEGSMENDADFDVQSTEQSNGDQEENKIENMTHAMYVESIKDDNFWYCVECKEENQGDCPVHGPMVVVQNIKVEENDPDRALHSLPPNLLVRESDIDGAGIGVFTEIEILPGTTYGPYEGIVIQGPEYYSSEHCWQIYRDGKLSHFVDATDIASSNWMRYVNCALSESDQNLAAFQYKGEIYYRCIKPILPKTELLVWYGDDCAKLLGISKDKGDNLSEKDDMKFKNDHMEPDKFTDEQVPDGPRYMCTVCNKSVTRKDKLRIHMRLHTGERPYTCKLCMKTFTDNTLLKRHMMMHTGDKPFQCYFCDKAFITNTMLTLHTRTHTGERPFKCDVCSKTFNHQSHLKIHHRMHTGEKPYVCNLCNKAFKQSTLLKVHRMKHTGEKPFKCNFCDKGFSMNAYLRKHIRTHTGEKPFKCDVCDQAFNQSYDMKIHMRRHLQDGSS